MIQMPEIIAPNLGLSYGWIDGEDGWGGPMSENMRAIDALLHLSVLSAQQAEPPVMAQEGDRYIVGPNPIGVWQDHATHIAVYIEGSWRFYVPRYGYRAKTAGAGFMWFDGTQWVAEAAGGGTEGGDGEPPAPVPRFYDIGISTLHPQAIGEKLVAMPLAQMCMLPPGAPGSFAMATAAPAGESAAYDLHRGSVIIGSITWAPGNAAGSFTVPTAVMFMPGDLLSITRSGPGGLSAVGITLRLTVMGA
ncbi:DUF2793 domain-containing protein [Castellaniella hirudinis]|uniref:DUF2793 domain-containing protein n=1 Tax=Castellaniella hirudinis TaxID=1144617 RepID=UPI0039C3EFB4